MTAAAAAVAVPAAAAAVWYQHLVDAVLSAAAEQPTVLPGALFLLEAAPDSSCA